MSNKTQTDQMYNPVGKSKFGAIPWKLLARADAPRGAIATWASIQRRNVFRQRAWKVGLVMADTRLSEADVRTAARWLEDNGFLKIDCERNEVAVIIPHDINDILPDVVSAGADR